MNSKLQILISVLIFFFAGCKEKNIDIPDIQKLYGNIAYLDSLFQSRTVDSIMTEKDKLQNLIESYKNNIRTAEDKVIIDSLIRISNVTDNFLRFCTDSRIDLELLNKDILTVENQYKSGKIKIGYYISALIESEQIEVNLINKYSEDLNSTISSLKNGNLIIKQLSPFMDVEPL